ncbi:MAG: hypothetical protein LBJ35_05895 [Spirochaetaceae bacterium]|jgi:hypothetical protein|nr:hypothetical protein [Spirochaetaceae bacterium]
MTVYLDADCALDALIKAGFIKPENWKRSNSKKYNAGFYHGSTNGTLCFQVSVEGDIHKISGLYIKNLERQYHVNLSPIVNNCAISNI